MKFSIQELRPELLAFALLMEQRLREKDTERGGNSWKNASAMEIIIPTTAKALHLDSVVRDVHHLNLIPTKHAVDLANYCMMIADVSGALNIHEEEDYEWVRDDEATFHVFLLIDAPGITQEVIASWTDAQCKQAEAWAMLTHYAASDNNVTVPPAPDFIAPLLVK